MAYALFHSKAQRDCPQVIGASFGLPFLGALGTQTRMLPNNQAIIPSYEAQCCGNITEWEAAFFSVLTDNFDIIFQVWRPSPTVENNGCYSLVGENRFTLGGLVNIGTINVAPLLSQQISVQRGDVLGFRLETNTASDEIRMDSSQSSEMVWYGNIDGIATKSSDCPYPVGETGLLHTFTDLGPGILATLCT